MWLLDKNIPRHIEPILRSKGIQFKTVTSHKWDELLTGQDYHLKQVPRAAFLTELRRFRNLPKETIFSQIDEENCQVAFAQSCSSVYFG